ncbi:MAG: dCTP deaminase [Marivivens sp.]|nr:dCTP deaminase [Marivivens sp.]NBT52368.1 dCTP deaminase [Marivivens sp.]NCW69438.1 dCTP deaminase [Marivivens sp.]
MILPDIEILSLTRLGLVTPFDPELLNPASLDVRLGENLLVEREERPSLEPFSIAGYTKENPFMLYPHEFILAETLEEFQLPDCVAGQLALKSSRAREGIEHLLAGYIDPGYSGRLTLELQNARQLHPVFLWPGMRIAQIVFHKLSMLPAKDYSVTGRYQGDTAVQASKG